ncbi:MAG: lysophospholipid acyltransferase family protein [Actinomycetota bacterium]
MSVVAERLAPSAPTRLPEWPRSPVAVELRALLQRVLLFPVLRLFCRPMRIERDPGLLAQEGPFVFVANHTSHADTALILRALPARLRRRLAPAAAEDYFFRGRAPGAILSLLIGAFPFPRRGRAGLARAERLLDDGWSILLFPEGTRSTDGHVGSFKPGVGVLAERGFRVVPIGIAGAREVMPKGRRLPRAHPVSILIGAPIEPDRALPPTVAAERIRRRVSRLHAAARLLRPPARRTVLQRARGLALSRRGLMFAFAWGVAEALFFPIVPDVGVALLAVAAPSRFLPLALASTAGSVAGGAVSYALGATPAGVWLLAHAPLVTDGMRQHAFEALGSGGAGALIGQPWTGIPFKVFGYQAAGAGVGLGSFLVHGLAGRGSRIVLAGAAFAGAAWAPHRLFPHWVERLYAPFVVAFLVLFGVGLARVVSSWS